MLERASPHVVDPIENVERQLGRYRIHRSIAAGGMATVNLATVDGHEGFSKLVALKVIHENLASDPHFVAMFLDEARIAARIEHANVCSVFDFGECDGSYYIAMEFLSGLTFSEVRDSVRKNGAGTDWPAMAASLVSQACEGLHAAHNLADDTGASIGLVHRDISPQNLFVTYSGTVKVVDFGIARAAGKSHQTAPGTLKGKFAYMSPEQLTDAERVDRRADVWALGATLWELLALRPLFRKANPAATLTAVMSEPIVPPSMFQKVVPHALDEIVLGALTRDPEKRYASAREFGRDLAGFCRAHGGLAGSLEVEEWLDGLVPGGREGSRSSSIVTPMESGSRPRPATREVSVRSEASSSSHTRSSSGLSVDARGPQAPAQSEPPDSRRDRVRGLIATGTLLLVGIAIGILTAVSQPAPPSVPAEADGVRVR